MPPKTQPNDEPPVARVFEDEPQEAPYEGPPYEEDRAEERPEEPAATNPAP